MMHLGIPSPYNRHWSGALHWLYLFSYTWLYTIPTVRHPSVLTQQVSVPRITILLLLTKHRNAIDYEIVAIHFITNQGNSVRLIIGRSVNFQPNTRQPNSRGRGSSGFRPDKQTAQLTRAASLTFADDINTVLCARTTPMNYKYTETDLNYWIHIIWPYSSVLPSDRFLRSCMHVLYVYA